MRTQVSEELRGLKVTEDAIGGILAVMAIRDVADLQKMLGDDTEVRHCTASALGGQSRLGLRQRRLGRPCRPDA